ELRRRGARVACADFPSPPANARACLCSRRLPAQARPSGPLSHRPASGRLGSWSSFRTPPDRHLDRSDRSRRPVRERSYPALLCAHLTIKFAPYIRVELQKIKTEPSFVGVSRR